MPPGEGSNPLLLRALTAYLNALHTKPVWVKSVTSAAVAVLADFSAQLLTLTADSDDDSEDVPSNNSGARVLNVASLVNYAVLGGLVTGPATHHFYRLLDAWLPLRASFWRLMQRLLADRLLFGPVFLLVSLYVLNRLEGRNHRASCRVIRLGFAAMFRANLKFWLPLQFINVNLVPQAYRVLFANMCAFCWVLIMAKKRKDVIACELKKRVD